MILQKDAAVRKIDRPFKKGFNSTNVIARRAKPDAATS